MDLVEWKLLLDGVKTSGWEVWMPAIGAMIGGVLTVGAAWLAAWKAMKNAHNMQIIEIKYKAYSKYISALTGWAVKIKDPVLKREYIQERSMVILFGNPKVIEGISLFESNCICKNNEKQDDYVWDIVRAMQMDLGHPVDLQEEDRKLKILLK